jgi:hypothetical protein
MRCYYRLFDDLYIPNRWHLGDIVSPDGDDPFLNTNTIYNGPIPLDCELYKKGCALPFCFTCLGIPVASEEITKAICDIAKHDVQCIPTNISGKCKAMVINVLREVECLDENRSEYMKWTKDDHRSDLAGQYRMITRLIIDPTVIPEDAHMFRVKGWVAIIVSSDVRAAMEKVGCYGAKYTNVQMP